MEVDTTVTWAVIDTSSIGSINQSGLFKALSEGAIQITATLGDISDTTNVTVGFATTLNKIEIFRVKTKGDTSKIGNFITEGESKNIAGLKHPLNFMNGAKLFFPENSLSEDIKIFIVLPKFAKDNGSGKEVTFGDSIAVGVSFVVTVNDSIISPFVFDIPLELTLPFKKGLLNNLGIDPLNLGLFFVDSTGGLDSTGITNVAVDDKGNKITANVAHFSDVAAVRKPGSITTQVASSIDIGGGKIDVSTIPGLSALGLDSLFVDFPSGAISAPINLQISVPTSIPAEKSALQAVEFTVEGETGQFNFASPVTIGIPYPDTVTDESSLTIKLWNPVINEWDTLELSGTVSVNSVSKIVSAQVNHFSIYGVLVEDIVTGVEDEDPSRIPDKFELGQNYPNPFNPETKIVYTVGVTSRVSITIYNLLGQEVRTIVDKVHTKGSFEVFWDAKDNFGTPVSSGVYIYQLHSENFTAGRRMILIR